MGLGSALSSGWSKVKKTAKSIARKAKSVAKKSLHALPGGDKLWALGTDIGGKIMGGIGKVVKAIGPVGMIALSIIIPAMGPALSAMWGSFGAAAQAMAASGSAIASALGTAGTAIFNGANFIGGTLGAMGEAIAQGSRALMEGGKAAFGNIGVTGESFITNMSQTFSKAGDAFTTKMGEAFTGKAGMASVTSMNKAAGQTILENAAKDTMALLPDAPQMSPLQEIIDPGGMSTRGLEQGFQNPLPGSEGLQQGALVDARQVDAFGVQIEASAAPLTPHQVAAKADPFAVAEAAGTSSFLDGAAKAAKIAGGLLDTGGGAGGISPDFDVASRKFTTVSAAGRAQAIRAHGDSNLFANILQQARGGFA